MPANLEEAIHAAARAAEAQDHAEAWRLLLPHRAEVGRALELAWAWLVLYARDPAPPPAADVLAELSDAWPANARFVDLLANAHLARVDGRPADDDVADDDPAIAAAALARRALDALDAPSGAEPEVGGALAMTYATALRLAGPRFEAEAERAHARLLEARPDAPSAHFNLGLFRKGCGRWAEALTAFRRARELGGEDPPTLWNVAIAATAAHQGEVALDAWRALGLEGKRGADGLPLVEELGRVRVRVARGPLGQPPTLGAALREEVWARALSPCHGVVLEPTRAALAADYGDLIVWDGAPFGWREQDGRRTPRFAMLARLAPGGARKLPFVARQPATGAARALNDALPDAVWVHVFDEEGRGPCARCLEGGPAHPGEHLGVPPLTTPHRVHGALVIEPESDPVEALRLLEPLLAERPELSLAIPALYAAAGALDRVAAEAARAAALG